MQNQNKLTIKDITLIAMMVAIIEVCKFTLASIPNVELTTFWIIMFTLFLGNRIFYAIPVFILIEGLLYGFGLWWIMYLYAWPFLAILTRLFSKSTSALTFSMFSGIYGLLYGLLCCIPYVFIGTFQGGLTHGFQVAFAWWIAGIPMDMIHGVSNFIIMLILYYPISTIMKRL